jgi:FRG domain
MSGATSITSVIDMLREAAELAATAQKHRHVRCWFRGQNDSRWKLHPRLYRVDPKDEQRIHEIRQEILLKERHLVRDFRHLSASIRKGDETDAMLYLMQQHYGASTRLLDWTTNPLIALYFACENDGLDGKWFAMDAYQMITKPEGNVETGIATIRHKSFKRMMKLICGWRDNVPHLPTKTFPLSPEHFDRRISLQQGVFTFHVPEEPILEEQALVRAYLIPKGQKGLIRDELAAVNINHFTVYGDLEALCRYLNERSK